MNKNFWDAIFRDTSDLAVIVAGDICGQQKDVDYMRLNDI